MQLRYTPNVQHAPTKLTEFVSIFLKIQQLLILVLLPPCLCTPAYRLCSLPASTKPKLKLKNRIQRARLYDELWRCRRRVIWRGTRQSRRCQKQAQVRSDLQSFRLTSLSEHHPPDYLSEAWPVLTTELPERNRVLSALKKQSSLSP